MKKTGLVFLLFSISCGRSGTVVHPVRKDIIETVYASGKIIPENEYRVFAMSNGTIKEKSVHEGDTVQKGEVLYRVDSEAPAARLDAAKTIYNTAQSNLSDQSRILNDLKLAVESADAKFKNDSVNYARLKKLLEQDAASRSSMDNALTAMTISQNMKRSAEEKYFAAKNELLIASQNAKSQLAAAQTDLDNYYIRSETSGTVFQLLKESGEAVHAGEMVALLGETSARIIRLSVDQQDIDKIKTGQDVLLKSDVSGNTVYHGTVSRIYPVMNEVDQTFRVDAVFKDNVQYPYVHSSVEANIVIQEKKNALIIPRAAMSSEDSVLVKQDGKTKNIFVETGVTTLEDVEVIKGLDESSEVVISGKQ